MFLLKNSLDKPNGYGKISREKKNGGDGEMKFLGDNLRKFREEVNMSRDDLAERIIKRNGKQVVTKTILNWERGPQKPDADSLAQMSELFNKDLILFFVPISYQNVLENKKPCGTKQRSKRTKVSTSTSRNGRN